MAAVREEVGDGMSVEIWWQDEARIGQKNKITRRWAAKGTRPRAPQDQRTAWAYIFGAICPAEGKGAGLVLPWCNTHAMDLHLQEISAAVAPGAHAVLIVDQAGWHMTPKLKTPKNITILPLPARAPRTQPRRERLAVHARQLALEPRLQKLRRDRRAVLRSMDNARRSAVAHHVPRSARLGQCVMLSESWYHSRRNCE
jgi:hypothetical protein